MKKLTAAAIAFAVLTLCASATQYSKLSIITTSKSMGKWQALKAWIAAADLQEEWDAAVYLSDDYGAFPAVTNSIISAGIATQVEVEAILAASVDTSIPDVFIRRAYSNDMQSASGRVRWHGKAASVSIDTNTLERTTRYEDGTIFKDQAKVVTPAQTAAAQLARLPRRAITNGVPAALAAARVRQLENATTTNTVTVTLRAGE